MADYDRGHRRTRILCVNCNICVNTLRRYQVLALDPRVAGLLCSWVCPRLVLQEDVVCEACRDLAIAVNEKDISGNTDQQAGSSHRGHTNVCLLCGLSTLRRQSDKILRSNPSQLQQTMVAILESRVAPREQEPAESENEIKVFCPKCNTEVSHAAEGIRKDQTKILVAKVYHYFEQEYEELKTNYGDLDLTPLTKFRQRTALATGVSEMTVLQILKEEEGRNAEKREAPPEEPRTVRKRSRQTESSSEEDCADDSADANEQSSTYHEMQTLVVKVEPSEYDNEEPEIYVPAAVKVEVGDIEVNQEQAETDPISLDLKTARSPRSDLIDNTSEALALTEPAATKRKGRKIPRSDVTSTRTSETLALTEPAATKRKGKKKPRSDVTSSRQHTQGESSTAAASSSVRLKEELDEAFCSETEMKTEEIEMDDEGPS